MGKFKKILLVLTSAVMLMGASFGLVACIDFSSDVYKTGDKVTFAKDKYVVESYEYLDMLNDIAAPDGKQYLKIVVSIESGNSTRTYFDQEKYRAEANGIEIYCLNEANYQTNNSLDKGWLTEKGAKVTGEIYFLVSAIGEGQTTNIKINFYNADAGLDPDFVVDLAKK